MFLRTLKYSSVLTRFSLLRASCSQRGTLRTWPNLTEVGALKAELLVHVWVGVLVCWGEEYFSHAKMDSHLSTQLGRPQQNQEHKKKTI